VTILCVDEVVERPHHEYSVKGPIRCRKFPGLTSTCRERPRVVCVSPTFGGFDVLFDRIDEEHVETGFGEMGRVRSWATPNVHHPSAGGQISGEYVPCSKPYQVTFSGNPESSVFVREFIASNNPFIHIHANKSCMHADS